MKKNLDKIHSKYDNNYEVILLKSIYLFLADRNTLEAINILKRCKRNRDGTWRLNLAFLSAYLGDLERAYREYCIARKMTLADSILIEVESFICNILEIEPKKYQLHFCLGIINWYLKGDTQQAIIDFKKFLEEKKDGEFEYQKIQVKSWLDELITKADL